MGNFPGSLVVRTWHFSIGDGVWSLVGELIRSHKPPKKTITNKKNSLYRNTMLGCFQGLARWLSSKRIRLLCRRRRRLRPWVRKIPWRKKWHPTPAVFPGKSHTQKGLAGYSPRDFLRVGHDLATKQQGVSKENKVNKFVYSFLFFLRKGTEEPSPK